MGVAHANFPDQSTGVDFPYPPTLADSSLLRFAPARDSVHVHLDENLGKNVIKDEAEDVGEWFGFGEHLV